MSATSAYPKALILAGGQGGRLRRLGEVLPKCLVPIFDEPLLVRQVGQCALAGVRDVYVSIAAAYADILETVISRYEERATAASRSGSFPAVRLHCVAEETPLGAIGGLIEAAKTVEDSHALILLGDEYSEHDDAFVALGAGPRTEDLVLGCLHTRNPARIVCNVVVDEHERVTRIRDKPSAEQIVGDIRWEGMMAVRPGFASAARDLRERGLVEGPQLGDLLEAFLRAGRTVGIQWLKEICLNVNSTDDVMLAALTTARTVWSRTRPELVPAVTQALEALLGVTD